MGNSFVFSYVSMEIPPPPPQAIIIAILLGEIGYAQKVAFQGQPPFAHGQMASVTAPIVSSKEFTLIIYTRIFENRVSKNIH